MEDVLGTLKMLVDMEYSNEEEVIVMKGFSCLGIGFALL